MALSRNDAEMGEIPTRTPLQSRPGTTWPETEPGGSWAFAVEKRWRESLYLDGLPPIKSVNIVCFLCGGVVEGGGDLEQCSKADGESFRCRPCLLRDRQAVRKST